MEQAKISRRKLLRLSGGLMAAAPFIWVAAPAFAEGPVIVPAKRPFGRAIQGGIAVREAPSIKAKLVRTLKLNEVIAVKGQTTSDESPTAYNKTWYQTDDGFAHSAFLQPADNVLNQPLDSVDPNGFWGEITVPLTEARGAPSPKSYLRYRYYYGCIFKIVANAVDDTKTMWYQIEDEYAGRGFFVKAEHVRPVQPDEFSPLSADVPADQKRLEVDLTKQVATAFENDKPVFSVRVATGATFRLAGGGVRSFGTIPGPHRIFHKTPTQHMVGGSVADNDYYDLPGIGWTSYFTSSGIAFHGTYWHNDYGHPRSHGCVNMLPEDAKWVFRWSLPTVNYADRDTRTAKPEDGTFVKVF